jgi:hypothetical protein
VKLAEEAGDGGGVTQQSAQAERAAAVSASGGIITKGVSFEKCPGPIARADARGSLWGDDGAIGWRGGMRRSKTVLPKGAGVVVVGRGAVRYGTRWVSGRDDVLAKARGGGEHTRVANLILPRRRHHGGKACEQSELVHVHGEGAVSKGTF